MTFLFPRGLRGLRPLVVPHFICTQWVHPLVLFLFSLEYVSVPSPLCMRTCSTPSLGFCSPSRHHSEESTCAELPSSHRVPFLVFHPLSTVSASSELLGLFHPKAAYKIRFPGGFPTTKPPRLVAVSYPLCISEVRLLRGCPHSANFPRRTFKVLRLVAIRYNHRWG